MGVGETLAGPAGLGDGADIAFRVAFVLLAVILAIPAIAALRLAHTAGSSVTRRT